MSFHFTYELENDGLIKIDNYSHIILDSLDKSKMNEIKPLPSLSEAIRRKQYALFKYYLRDEETDVNKVNDKSGCPAIHFAVQSNDDIFLKMLLKRKDLDINLEGSKCAHPLHTAAVKGNLHLVNLLLRDDRLIINEKIKESIYTGAYHKKEINDAILAKLELPVEPTANLNEKLLDVITNKNIDAAKELINNPEVDINYQNELGETALHLATTYDLIEIIKILFNHPKINVNIQNKLGYSPIFYVLDLYINKDKDGIIKPYMRYKSINLDILKLYLDNKNIDLALESNHKANFFESLLGYNPSIEVYNVILNNPNIDPNFPYFHNHNTFLSISIYNNNIKIINHLINHPRVDINLGVKNFQTPIEYAVKMQNVDAVKLLLDSPRFKMTNYIYFILTKIDTRNSINKTILELINKYVDSINVNFKTTKINNTFKIKGLILPIELQNIIVTQFHHKINSYLTKHNLPLINVRHTLSYKPTYNIGLTVYGNQIITDYIGKTTQSGVCSTHINLELSFCIITYNNERYSIIGQSNYNSFIELLKNDPNKNKIIKHLKDTFNIDYKLKRNEKIIKELRELYKICKEPLFFIIGYVDYMKLDTNTQSAHRSSIIINKNTNEILISDSAMSYYPYNHFRNLELYIESITDTKNRFKITRETENCRIDLQQKSDDDLCTVWSVMLLHIWLLNPQLHLSKIVKLLYAATKEQLNILINGYTLYLNKFFSQKESILKEIKELTKMEDGVINRSKLIPSIRKNILNAIKETRRLKAEGLNLTRTKSIFKNTRKNNVTGNFRKKTTRNKLKNTSNSYSKSQINLKRKLNNKSTYTMYTRATIRRMKEQGLPIPPEYQ